VGRTLLSDAFDFALALDFDFDLTGKGTASAVPQSATKNERG
jgi:hypothetical protein